LSKRDSVSPTTVAAGTPQGTVSGPNDFKVIINNLTFNTTYAKYADDIIVLSVSQVRIFLFSGHNITLWQLILTKPKS